ncbi:group III truncated hemoglobin [Bosea vestrisii]|uniref:group III truncated hemoglobin n=1 Tax=Bosea vestrisii TaxID=151416 RepID=UPI0024DF70E6|nr:group III truncated hemoglobin [Bosea vestrisii]WID94430.1 group III truncated hemoglobin [Bosea vestrisii]
MSGIPLPERITEELIAELVETFYGRVRQDPLIGPIFLAKLGDDWGAHLAKLRDFWSSVTLMSGRYRGKPQQVHMPLPLEMQHFERWLSLFETTVAELCTGPAAFLFVDRAHRIADSLQISLNIGPKALNLPQRAVG